MLHNKMIGSHSLKRKRPNVSTKCFRWRSAVLAARTTVRSQTATRLESRRCLPRSTSHSIVRARGTRPRRLQLLPRELTLGRSSPTRSQRRQRTGSVELLSPRSDPSLCPCPSVWSKSLLRPSHRRSRRSRRGSRIRTRQLSS